MGQHTSAPKGRHVCKTMDIHGCIRIKAELVVCMCLPGRSVHDMVTIKRALGLRPLGHPETAYSWFPGYAWTIVNCTICREHMVSCNMNYSFNIQQFQLVCCGTKCCNSFNINCMAANAAAEINDDHPWKVKVSKVLHFFSTISRAPGFTCQSFLQVPLWLCTIDDCLLSLICCCRVTSQLLVIQYYSVLVMACPNAINIIG